MQWTANARGVDEHGTPLVAIYGSEELNAVDRARLVARAPDLLLAAEELLLMLDSTDLSPLGIDNCAKIECAVRPLYAAVTLAGNGR